MKSRVVIGVCLAVGVAGLVLLFFPRSYQRSQVGSLGDVPKYENFNAILLGSRKNSSPLAETAEVGCRDLWSRVRTLDLQRLNEDIFRGCLLLPAADECNHPPTSLSVNHALYVRDCARFMSAGYDKQAGVDLDAKAHQCFISLVAYRAAVGSWMTQDQPLEAIADVEVLGDKLLDESFASLRGQTPSPEKLRAIAERVNEINPNIYSTSKISAVGSVLDALSNPSEENWSRARESVEKLERLGKEDPELGPLVLWAKTEGMKPEKFREEASEMVKRNPDSGLGYFYLAFAEARMTSDRQKVEALFLDAVQAEPTNPTFVTALENFRARRPIAPPVEFEFDFRIAELTE